MRYKKKFGFLILLLTLIFFTNCEKDDICVDGDTPLLIIRFYDINDETKLKPVPLLRIVGEGKNTTVNTIADRSSKLDSIGLPLKIDATTTSFSFIKDSADSEGEVKTETGNIDILNFTYTTKEIFVSRACGYIANYEDLGNTITTDSDLWIKKIEVITTTIENKPGAHVKIFH
ncbi:MAG: DUF6452 family protein [Cellulophaga sp.]